MGPATGPFASTATTFASTTATTSLPTVAANSATIGSSRTYGGQERVCPS